MLHFGIVKSFICVLCAYLPRHQMTPSHSICVTPPDPPTITSTTSRIDFVVDDNTTINKLGVLQHFFALIFFPEDNNLGSDGDDKRT